MAITIKSEREIELMAEAGKILERVHNELEKALHPGMSTKDIDTLGEKMHQKLWMYSFFPELQWIPCIDLCIGEPGSCSWNSG